MPTCIKCGQLTLLTDDIHITKRGMKIDEYVYCCQCVRTIKGRCCFSWSAALEDGKDLKPMIGFAGEWYFLEPLDSPAEAIKFCPWCGDCKVVDTRGCDISYDVCDEECR